MALECRRRVRLLVQFLCSSSGRPGLALLLQLVSAPRLDRALKTGLLRSGQRARLPVIRKLPPAQHSS